MCGLRVPLKLWKVHTFTVPYRNKSGNLLSCIAIESNIKI